MERGDATTPFIKSIAQRITWIKITQYQAFNIDGLRETEKL
jgi:hypothetical protein